MTLLATGGRLLSSAGILLSTAQDYPAYDVLRWNSSMLQASRLRFPAALSQQLGMTSFTFEFWTIPSGVTGQMYVLDQDTADERFMCHLPLSNGAIYVASGNINLGGQTPGIYPPGNIFAGDPHHFAAVVDLDARTMSVVLDGELLYLHNNATQRIGNDNRLTFPQQQGRAGMIRYWNYARTVSQIAADKDLVFTRPQPGLMLDCRCDERGPAGTLVRDRSGNGYHATTY